VQILISAGEASGEMYGAQLISALRRLDPSLDFFGVGGEKMRAAGLARDFAGFQGDGVLAVLKRFLMDIEQDDFLSWKPGLPNQSADSASG